MPWRGPATWIGIAAPLVALAFTLPKTIATLRGFDVPHHLAATDAQRSSGGLGFALDPHHLIDVANQLIVLAPLALMVLVLLPGAFRRGRRLEALALAASLLPWLAVVLARLGREQEGRTLLAQHAAKTPGFTISDWIARHRPRNAVAAAQFAPVAETMRRFDVADTRVKAEAKVGSTP